MRKSLFSLALAVIAYCGATPAVAQVATEPAKIAVVPEYGRMSYKAVVAQLPEYTEAQAQIKRVHAQYDAETRHNEAAFQQMYADFLAGQKGFTKNILEKRQNELKDAMERGLKFRLEAQKLVAQAEADIMGVLYRRVDAAVARVAHDLHLKLVVNTDERAVLYTPPHLTANIELMVLEEAKKLMP